VKIEQFLNFFDGENLNFFSIFSERHCQILSFYGLINLILPNITLPGLRLPPSRRYWLLGGSIHPKLYRPTGEIGFLAVVFT
jgi:hypothetical protein